MSSHTPVDNDLPTQDANDDAPYKRIVNTFMKRRTHMNKKAEHALSHPEFSRYLVNNGLGDGDLSGDIRGDMG